MEILLFFKKGIKNVEIDYFQYQLISSGLEEKIKEGIVSFENIIDDKYEKRLYDPLSEERGRYILETLSLEETRNGSELLNQIIKVVYGKQYVNNFSTIQTKKTYFINETDGFYGSEFPIKFYVIKYNGKIFFKATNESDYFLKNKMKILTHLEEASMKKIEENIMLIDTNFDFYIEGETIYIKNSTKFESISNYEEIYEHHRAEVLDSISNTNVISNYDEFVKECSKKFYLRIFKKVPTHDTQIQELLNKKEFLESIIKQSENNIQWADNSEKQIKVSTTHVKTVLHLFSGLIGKDIHEEVVTFNEKDKLKP